MNHPNPAGGFLCSERLYLRPVEPEDLPCFYAWNNTPELRDLIGENMPQSRQELTDWLERSRQRTDRVWFTVVLREGNRPIGEAGLLRWFPAWRTSDVSMILGDPTARGHGYGSEALHLLLDYAFGTLNLHRLAIGVVDFNHPALRFWEKAGFKTEGIQEQGYYCHHRYYNFIMMRLLEDEYRTLYPPQTPAAPVD